MSDRLSLIERCPTCGHTGPDAIDRVGDYGGDVFEARCGSEWHDGWVAGSEQLRGAVEALQHIAESSEHPSLTVRTTNYLGHVARKWLDENGYSATTGGQ